MIFELFILILILLLFWIYFHRSPKINLDYVSDKMVLAPCYGRVQKIIEKDNEIHIITFLSPKDIHVQYYPINGKIIKQIRDETGQYHLAFKLNKSDNNEKVITVIQPTNPDIGPITVQQIAGFVARRIVTPKKINVTHGERLGMIRLGSRVDLIIPKTNLTKLFVKEGDYLQGPYTPISFYDNAN